MFAKTIIDSDAFIDMPVTSRLLYYDLAMRADDDGFVNSPKKIMRMIGASEDDIRILISRKFIIPFDNGIVVIKHWRIHNYIRKDTYNETPYTDQKALLEIDENNAYKFKDSTPVYDPSTDSQRTVNDQSTQVRLGKVSIGKDSNISAEHSKNTPALSGIQLPLVDKTCFDVPISDIEMWYEAYPAVDVKSELLKMIAWLNSNPNKRKTKRGVKRFINSWLSRVQDKGGSKATYSNYNQPVAKKAEEPALNYWGDD